MQWLFIIVKNAMMIAMIQNVTPVDLKHHLKDTIQFIGVNGVRKLILKMAPLPDRALEPVTERVFRYEAGSLVFEVGPSGTVIAQFGPRGNAAERQARADRLGNVDAVFEGLPTIGAGVADRAVTALSLHHRNTAFLREIYEALKPGGMAVIIDHEGKLRFSEDLTELAND